MAYLHEAFMSPILPHSLTEASSPIAEKLASPASFITAAGDGSPLYSELWHACAGTNASLAEVGSRAIYCPQGHMEQIAASMSQDPEQQMPSYNLPSQLACHVLGLQLRADPETDDVYAQYTLLPESEAIDKIIDLEENVNSPLRDRVHVFRKTLTPSDTSTHGGFSVPKKAARECLPPLDYNEEPPAQELVMKDLHGVEWKFRHIYRGFPKRHLLTTGWSIFVSQKRLVAGDVVIFIRGENGEMRIGVRRATRQPSSVPSSVLSSHSMQMGVLAAASHAVSTKTMFKIFYNPRTSPSEFVVPFSKYVEAMKSNVSIGMRVKIIVETDSITEQRNTGTVVGISDIDPIRWPGSKWRSIKVNWDEQTCKEWQERVSPWEIEPIVFPTGLISSAGSRSKRPRPLLASAPPNVSVSGCNSLMASEAVTQSNFPRVFQGQEARSYLPMDKGVARGISSPTAVRIIEPPPVWSFKDGDSKYDSRDEMISAAGTKTSDVRHGHFNMAVLPGLPGISSTSETFTTCSLELTQQQQVRFLARPLHEQDRSLPLELLHAIQRQSMGPPAVSSSGKSRPHFLETELQLCVNSSSSVPQCSNSRRSELPSPPGARLQSLSYSVSGGGSGRRMCSTSLASPPEASGVTDETDPDPFAKPTDRNLRSCGLSPQSNLSSWDRRSDEGPHECPYKKESSCKIFGVPLNEKPADAHDIEPIQTEILKTGNCSNTALGTSGVMGEKVALSSPDEEMSTHTASADPFWSPFHGRRCTKVHKQGNAVGRAIDLSKFRSYSELFQELEQMFSVSGELTDVRKGWLVVYTDDERDMMLVGDGPWEQFCRAVRKIFILTKEDVEKLNLSNLKARNVPFQQLVREEELEEEEELEGIERLEDRKETSRCSTLGNHDSSSQVTVSCRSSDF